MPRIEEDTPLITNREGWLMELARQVEPIFKGFSVKPYRISCGWPCRGGLGATAYIAGECHPIETSQGGVFEIFINPRVANPLLVGGTVCHELAHVVAGTKAKHGKGFVRICNHVGLTSGKPKSVMPGPRLNDRLQRIVEKLGEYPHKAMVPQFKPKKARTSASLICPSCGCTLTISLKWLELAGFPKCACGTEFQQKEE